jgi:hypothetical protein
MTLDQFLKHPNTVGLLKAVSQSPGDGLPRLMLADHATEYGFDNIAAGQRWAAKNKKAPHIGHTLGGAGGWFPHFGRDRHGHTPTYPAQSEGRHLPHFFGEAGGYQRWTDSPLFTRNSYSDDDLPTHEADFLSASHHLDWHPETGEPIAPK